MPFRVQMSQGFVPEHLALRALHASQALSGASAGDSEKRSACCPSTYLVTFRILRPSVWSITRRSRPSQCCCGVPGLTREPLLQSRDEGMEGGVAKLSSLLHTVTAIEFTLTRDIRA